MREINRVPKVLWFFVMFLIVSAAAFAQDSVKVQSPSIPAPTTIPSPKEPSTSQQSKSSPRSQDLSFNTEAATLANELINQTGLSSDKAVKIAEVLKNYRNSIAEARADYYEKHPKTTEDQDATGSSTAKVDMKNILGDKVDQYYTGTPSDLMSDYRDADKKADGKIKDVFDDDVQTSRYEQIKGQWWSDVKDKVFSSLKQNPQNKNDMQNQNDMNRQNDMHNQSDTTKY
ncbi:MAG: hypothetical protein ACM3QX_13695 [Syntrophomonadaceae bacterium]